MRDDAPPPPNLHAALLQLFPPTRTCSVAVELGDSLYALDVSLRRVVSSSAVASALSKQATGYHTGMLPRNCRLMAVSADGYRKYVVEKPPRLMPVRLQHGMSPTAALNETILQIWLPWQIYMICCDASGRYQWHEPYLHTHPIRAQSDVVSYYALPNMHADGVRPCMGTAFVPPEADQGVEALAAYIHESHFDSRYNSDLRWTIAPPNTLAQYVPHCPLDGVTAEDFVAMGPIMKTFFRWHAWGRQSGPLRTPPENPARDVCRMNWTSSERTVSRIARLDET